MKKLKTKEKLLANTLEITSDSSDNQESGKEEKSSKVYYFDNIKSLAIIWLSFIHEGLFFSSKTFNIFRADWYDAFKGNSDMIGLSVFFGFAFLMGPFFFLVGYFGEQSLVKYGYVKFIFNKVVRLVIPFVLFMSFLAFSMSFFTLSNMSPVFVSYSFVGKIQTIFPVFIRYFSIQSVSDFLIKTFHLWFIVTSFVLYVVYKPLVALVYKIWNVGLKKIMNNGYEIVTSVALMTILSFLFKIVPYESLFLYKYRLDYYGIYIFFFVVGYLAYKEKILENKKKFNLKIHAFLIVLVLFLSWILFGSNGILQSGSFFSISIKNLIFSLFQAILAVSANIILYVVAKEKFNYTNKFLTFLAKYSYGVFLLEFPMHFLMRGIFVGLNQNLHVFYFFMNSIIVIIVSYLVAFLLKKLPVFKQVL